MDDDDAAEYAELWGVDLEDVYDIFEAMAYDDARGDLDYADYEERRDYASRGTPGSVDYREDVADYLEGLADEYDVDISDLYDMYYGYTEEAA